MPRRALTTADLTAARLAYDAGATFQALAAQHGVAKSTMAKMLHSVGVVARPVGAPRRPPKRRPAPARPRRQRVVTLPRPPWAGMRIPCRTPAERQRRWFTTAEVAAIAQAVAAGRVERAHRGRSGLPERLSWHEQRRLSWLALHERAAA